MNTQDITNAVADSNRVIAEASEVMRSARQEIFAKDQLIAHYRRKDAEHERLIGRLYELLGAENLDDALDLVRAEYVAIHGPSDGNAG